MRFHLDRRSHHAANDSHSADDAQIGPDDAEWPGEQARRMNDDYRSWRQDRYRGSCDDNARRRDSPTGSGQDCRLPAMATTTTQDTHERDREP